MLDFVNKRGVRSALLLHALLLLLLGLLTVRATGCRRSHPVVIPIAFMVAMAPEDPDRPDAASHAREMPPEPEPEAVPEPEPEPRPRPRRTPVQVSRQRVVRQPETGSPPPPTLTPEEIQRLLDQGAQPGTRTTVPDEDQRAMLRVREALHGAWRQPTRAEAGPNPVIVEVALGAGGVVGSPRIIQSSGSQIMDASVLRAVADVPVIPGLPSGFLQRYPRLRVEFRIR